MAEGRKHFSLHNKEVIRVQKQLQKGAQGVQQSSKYQPNQKQEKHIIDASFIDQKIKQKCKTNHQQRGYQKIFKTSYGLKGIFAVDKNQHGLK